MQCCTGETAALCWIPEGYPSNVLTPKCSEMGVSSCWFFFPNVFLMCQSKTSLSSGLGARRLHGSFISFFSKLQQDFVSIAKLCSFCRTAAQQEALVRSSMGLAHVALGCQSWSEVMLLLTFHHQSCAAGQRVG